MPLSSPPGAPALAHVRHLVVHHNLRGAVPSGHFAVSDGASQYLMASGSVEQTAVLAALAKLTGSQVIAIAGGSYGGTADTVTNHITRVTG